MRNLVMNCIRIATFLIAYCALSAWAGGIESLETFVKTVKTGRADFSQAVTSPGKDGLPARTKTSRGTFEFSRPNRFKFVYTKPFEQTIVADGQTLWLYDADLNQVTSRKQAAALGATPAALIAAAPDLKALQADFALSAAPEKEGLEWVQATPKARDGSLQNVRVGFRSGELSVLEILDSFGQKSVMTFTGFVANAPLDSAAFQFKPPAGADVIRQ
jgi:outer membrane lipoprotein carrier protein